MLRAYGLQRTLFVRKVSVTQQQLSKWQYSSTFSTTSGTNDTPVKRTIDASIGNAAKAIPNFSSGRSLRDSFEKVSSFRQASKVTADKVSEDIIAQLKSARPFAPAASAPASAVKTLKPPVEDIDDLIEEAGTEIASEGELRHQKKLQKIQINQQKRNDPTPDKKELEHLQAQKKAQQKAEMREQQEKKKLKATTVNLSSYLDKNNSQSQASTAPILSPDILTSNVSAPPTSTTNTSKIINTSTSTSANTNSNASATGSSSATTKLPPKDATSNTPAVAPNTVNASPAVSTPLPFKSPTGFNLSAAMAQRQQARAAASVGTTTVTNTGGQAGSNSAASATSNKVVDTLSKSSFSSSGTSIDDFNVGGPRKSIFDIRSTFAKSVRGNAHDSSNSNGGNNGYNRSSSNSSNSNNSYANNKTKDVKKADQIIDIRFKSKVQQDTIKGFLNTKVNSEEGALAQGKAGAQGGVRKLLIPLEGLSPRMIAQRLSLRLSDLRTQLEGIGEWPQPDTTSGISPEDTLIDADVVEIIAMDMGIEIQRVSALTSSSSSSSANSTPARIEELQRQNFRARMQLQNVQAEAEGLQLQTRAPTVCIVGHVDHGKTTLLDALRSFSSTSNAASSVEAAKQKVSKKKPVASPAADEGVQKVAGQEAGGITQRLSAFTVHCAHPSASPSTTASSTASSFSTAVFLDTPGHAAFSSMRRKGALATDIAVLVVALDEGVMPQTVEAIKAITSAQSTCIIALNKVDKVAPDQREKMRLRVLTSIAEHHLLAEELGGEIQVVEVSGKTGLGITDLLQAVQMQAELLDLKCVVDASAEAVVLDAKVEKGRGVVAEVLVRAGSLKVGDNVVVGQVAGRVKALHMDAQSLLASAASATSGKGGARGSASSSSGGANAFVDVPKALPSQPVRLVGLKELPMSGAELLVVESEAVAKDIAERRTKLHLLREQLAQQQLNMRSVISANATGDAGRGNGASPRTPSSSSSSATSSAPSASTTAASRTTSASNALAVILKADSLGALEALQQIVQEVQESCVTQQRAFLQQLQSKQQLAQLATSSSTTSPAEEVQDATSAALREAKALLQSGAATAPGAPAVVSTPATPPPLPSLLKIAHAAVGSVSQSDLDLLQGGAQGSATPLILAYNVGIADQATKTRMKQLDVDVVQDDVIYRLEEVLRGRIEDSLPAVREEVREGVAVVKKVFKMQNATIAGSYVTHGRLVSLSVLQREEQKNAASSSSSSTPRVSGFYRVMRQGSVIHEQPLHLSSLKRFKDSANEVASGLECGLSLDGFNDIQENDELHCVKVALRKVTLPMAPVYRASSDSSSKTTAAANSASDTPSKKTNATSNASSQKKEEEDDDDDDDDDFDDDDDDDRSSKHKQQQKSKKDNDKKKKKSKK